jgi:hypothetical protein
VDLETVPAIRRRGRGAFWRWHRSSRHVRGRLARVEAVERRRLGQDRGFEATQLGPGLDAQLVAEHGPAALVGAQGVRLPPRSVGRHDELSPAPLAQRPLLDHLLQLGSRSGVAAQRQPGVDAVFEGAVPGFGQTGRGRHRPRLRPELGKGMPPPQAQCLVEPIEGKLGLPAVEEVPPGAGRLDKPAAVHVLRLNLQDIAGILGTSTRAGARGGRSGSRMRRSCGT